jgi:general nucleoside transport system permease protein
MRLEAREKLSRVAAVAAPLGAIAATLAISAILVKVAGAEVPAAFGALLRGGFGSRFAIAATLTRATPLIFTGLAAAVPRGSSISAPSQLSPWAASSAARSGGRRRCCSC